METVLDKKIAESIDKHLARYQELLEKRTALEARLRKVDAEKNSVKDTIYAKVRKEYQKELDKLAREISPVEEEVGKIRDMISAEMARLDEQIGGCEDKAAEFAFRHRVGEFTEDDLAKKQRPLEQEVGDLKNRKSELERSMHELDTRPDTASSPSARVKSDSISEGAGASPSATKPDGQDLVDPTDWMREFAEDGTSAGTGRPPTARSNQDSSSLSTLADPSDEANTKREGSAKQADRGATERPKSFPVLVITRGPGAGKKVPLVPMTMTVGREHDNNIELKDEDVSRYHARIAYERGAYIIQDLESSSGTWVNDKRITEAKLTHGDKIRLGSTEMMINFD